MSTRKSGLGRGLEALIPVGETVGGEFMHLGVEKIHPNPSQPRSKFEETALDELAASIREVGLLQPVVVSASEKGYVLIAGERRWRAAKLAGLSTIPAVVRGSSGESSLVEALVENVQRQDLTALEEAHAYHQLLEDYGMTQEKIAERVGKSRSAVANTLRLLQLPGAIQTMIDAGSLSPGHGRALLGVEDEPYVLYLAEKAIAEGWNVRQLEEAVRARKEADTTPVRRRGSAVRSIRPVEIIELEKRLGEHLEARVKISYRNEKGKVEIKFGSLEELERLYRVMS